MLKVELTCLQALSDLDQMEAAWLEVMSAGDPKGAALIIRLLMAHIAMTGKRLLGAMVLDRLDADLLSTRADFPDLCQRLVNGADFVNEGNS